MPTAIEKIQARAKALRKSYPKAKWTDLIKKASADLKKIGAIGKVTTKKKATKKTATKKVKVLEVRKQYGTSKKSNDKRFQALLPGKRVSKSGRVYVERRANRTDKGVLLGLPKSTHKDTKSHNVRISVMSGVNSKLNELKNLRLKLKEAQIILKKEKDTLQKMYINAHRISPLRYNIKKLETELKSVKKELNKIK